MIVLAVVAALLAAILLMPVKIFAVYRGSLRVWVKVLFLRFDIIPKKEKPKERPVKKEKPVKTEEPPERPPAPPEPPKKEPAKPPKPEKEKPDKKQTEKKREKPPKQKKPEEPAPVEEAGETAGFVDKFLHYYDMACELIGPFKKALRRLLKLNLLKADIRVGVQDAADTAVYTGMLWAVAGNLLGLLTQFVTVERPEISIAPAYNETVLEAGGECIIRTNPANIIGAVVIAALGWLRYKRKSKKQEE